METLTKFSAAAAFAVCVAPALVAKPQPPVEIKEAEMPQFVEGLLAQFKMESQESARAVAIYHDLRKSFKISHTTMGDWLGVKRRSLYNWMNDPESAIKYGKQIEYRLDALSKLMDDMEPEHLPLLQKVAFSPIYGDPKFGQSILDGKSSEQLMAWYDKLFSRFESYRGTIKRKSNIV